MYSRHPRPVEEGYQGQRALTASRTDDEHDHAQSMFITRKRRRTQWLIC